MKAALFLGGYFTLVVMLIGVFAINQRSINRRMGAYGEDGRIRRVTEGERRADVLEADKELWFVSLFGLGGCYEDL